MTTAYGIKHPGTQSTNSVRSFVLHFCLVQDPDLAFSVHVSCVDWRGYVYNSATSLYWVWLDYWIPSGIAELPAVKGGCLLRLCMSRFFACAPLQSHPGQWFMEKWGWGSARTFASCKSKPFDLGLQFYYSSIVFIFHCSRCFCTLALGSLQCCEKCSGKILKHTVQ